MAKGRLVSSAGSAPELNLAWHREHLPRMVALTGTYYFVLVPSETPGNLALVEFDLVTHMGRPAGEIYANPLQLISPRDPDLTAAGPTPVQCPREVALIRRLYQRAESASYVLPRIVPTDKAPPWARGTISAKDRHTLWRAGGA